MSSTPAEDHRRAVHGDGSTTGRSALKLRCVVLVAVVLGSIAFPSGLTVAGTAAAAGNDVSASFGDATVQNNGTGTDTTLSLDPHTSGGAVNVTAEKLTGAELFYVFTDQEVTIPRDADPRDPDASTTVDGVALYEGSKLLITDASAFDGSEVTFQDTAEGEYAFEFEAADPNVDTTDTASIEVDERERSASFSQDVYQTPAGDIVEVSVSFENTDRGYLLVGGGMVPGGTGPTNYLDVLYVGDGATFYINTRLLGTNASSERVYRATSGEVVSYAHKYGATTDPDETSEFDGLAFEDRKSRPVATDLAGFREHLGIEGLPRPMQPARIRLVAGAGSDIVVRDNGIPVPRHSLARSNLRLTQPRIEGIETYVAPGDSANDIDQTDVESGTFNAPSSARTERSTVARGDKLIIEIEATGVYGTFLNVTESPSTLFDGFGPSGLSQFTSREDGVEFNVTEVNLKPNESPIPFRPGDATPGDLYVVTDAQTNGRNAPIIERFYVIIDTRQRRPFDEVPDDGARFNIRFAYNDTGSYQFEQTPAGERPPAYDPAGDTEPFPYVSERQVVNTTVTFEQPTVGYDQTSESGQLVLGPTTNARISGTTNIAPNSPIWIQLVSGETSPPETIDLKRGTVGSDGEFSFVADLSTLNAGDTVRVQFYAGRPEDPGEAQRLIDERTATVSAEPNNPVRLEVVNTSESVTVTEDNPLEPVTARVRNVGAVEGPGSVELLIDGERITERTVYLDANETRSISFGESYANREPGLYTYTVASGSDEGAGQIVIESETTPTATAATATPTPTATSTATATPTAAASGTARPTATTVSTTETPSSTENSPVPLLPMLGAVGVRDAVTGTLIVGSVYLLGHAV